MREVGNARRRSVLFVIRSLDRGGAERQILELLSSIDKNRFVVELATLYGDGPLRREAEAIEGLRLHSLGKRGRWDLAAVVRLCRLVRRMRPDIVHGYMEIPNCLGWAAGKLTGAKVVWGVRGSDNRDFGHYDRLGNAVFSLARLLSRFVDLAIFNSGSGRDYYLRKGYAFRSSIVIPNGIDIERFRFDCAGRSRVRARLGIADQHFLIGIAARLDRKKDHPTFLSAAAMLTRERSDVVFACVGSGPPPYAAKLQRTARELGIGARIRWTGALDDMPAAYSAFDIATLCSAYGEGFPNAIGEAMACARPCVVTPSGDSAHVVGDTGLIVAPGDPQGLAAAWKRMLEMTAEQRENLGIEARNRIASQFHKKLLKQHAEDALSAL